MGDIQWQEHTRRSKWPQLGSQAAEKDEQIFFIAARESQQHDAAVAFNGGKACQAVISFENKLEIPYPRGIYPQKKLFANHDKALKFTTGLKHKQRA